MAAASIRYEIITVICAFLASQVISHPVAGQPVSDSATLESGPAPKIIPSSPQLQQEPFLKPSHSSPKQGSRSSFSTSEATPSISIWARTFKRAPFPAKFFHRWGQS
ncbi:uncharacterized protein LOC118433327 [Folsomia candida]|uniref:uncharacterized protein LOC118433327 n=1 Tax=Folsomia candida TaxID=158441 RepID=UPI001604C0C1|nr:uncharacterized protein LOC118433327 [Folsomia candida]